MIIVLIALGLLLVITLYWSIRCILGRKFLKEVKQDSLIVFGKKGKGKTLLFSEMTRMDKEGFCSNTDFRRKKGKTININEISVGDNTWEDVLEGNIKFITKKEFEKKPIYIDDAGIYLPNFADTMLKKKYPSMPIAFAVWRHLYDAPIHINSQDVNRVWKLLKEQQSGCIQARKCWRLGPLAIIHCTYYDKIASAEAQLIPMKESIFNKYNKAELNMYNANNGLIKDFVIFAPSWRNKYDSRWFHKKFFGVDAPKKEKKKKKKE